MHPTAGHLSAIVGVAACPGRAVPEVAAGMRRSGADVVEVEVGVAGAMPTADLVAFARAAGGRLGLRAGGVAPDEVAAAVTDVAAVVPVTHLADPAGTCDPGMLAALLGSAVPVVLVGGPDPTAAAARVTAVVRTAAGPGGQVVPDPGGPGDPVRFGEAAAAAVRLRRRHRPAALTVPAGVAAAPDGLALVAWAVEERVPVLRTGPELAAVKLAWRIAVRLTSRPPGDRCGGDGAGGAAGSEDGP